MSELVRIFVEILGPVALVVTAGAVAGRRLGFDASTLAKLAYWILGPVFIFDVLASADLAPGLVVRVLAATVGAMLTVAGIVAAAARLSGRTYAAGAAAVLTSIYGNVGNFGLAIVAFTFGEEALPLAGLVLLPVNVIGLILGVAAASAQRMAPLGAVRAALVAPMTLAVVPAVVVNWANLELPVWLDRPVSLVARALIPVMLLTLGVQLSSMRMPRVGLDIALPLAAKLVVAPAVAALAVTVAGLEGVAAGVVTLQSAMPAAVFTALIALEHDLAPDLVTTIVLSGTLAAAITVPAVIAMVA